MNMKEYLSRAYRLDRRINSKLEQIASLHDLAEKATATLSYMPGSHNQGSSTMADTIDKMIDLENEINKDIDALVDLKREIIGTIKAVENPEYQTLLELRYLCFKTWEQIAVDMGYSLQHIFRIHSNAINAIDAKVESKCDCMRVSKCGSIRIEI